MVDTIKKYALRIIVYEPGTRARLEEKIYTSINEAVDDLNILAAVAMKEQLTAQQYELLGKKWKLPHTARVQNIEGLYSVTYEKLKVEGLNIG